MQRPTRGALGVSGGLILSFAVAAQAQDEGVKRVEQLIKSAGSTVQAISEAKLQFMKTIDVYNAILAEGAKDRKKLYKKLQSEMESTEEKRAEVGRRADQMRLEAGIVFKSWADSTVGIENPDLRKRSEERLEKTKDRCAEIESAGRSAVEVYAPVMKALQDQVTYLGHDLNAEAVASLKPDAEKVNAQAQELTKRVDEAIGIANTNINALRPE
jgi:uncharacterized protein YdhG (YjbR/CyaY superfamily)